MRCHARAAPKRAWIFASGTFEGSLGWYPQQYNAWVSGADPDGQAFSLPSPTNKYYYPGGYDDPEILRLKRESSDDFFMERIMGVPSPPKGLVFPQFRPDLHVKDIDFDPDQPVHIWVDPGYAGGYAVEAVQIINESNPDVALTIEDIPDRDAKTFELLRSTKTGCGRTHAGTGPEDVGRHSIA